MGMNARIYIAIPTYNRMRLAELCIPTVRAGMEPEDGLVVYDDGSRDKPWDSPAIKEAATSFVDCDSMGIDAQRRKHILDFWNNRDLHGCTHLYLADSDAPHDPGWREAALSLQEEYKAPVCLYRTLTHASYENNVFCDNPMERVIWQRFAPGVSYFLSLKMVAKAVSFIPPAWSWDWHLPGLLGYRMAISRVSYVDHIGLHGLHDPESGIGPERALNPTQWLVAKRAEIIHELNATAGS